jgi:hypothetical protein
MKSRNVAINNQYLMRMNLAGKGNQEKIQENSKKERKKKRPAGSSSTTGAPAA